MQKAIQIIKKYPLSVFCIALIWVLSLVPFFPETPLDGIDFVDKWTHLVMYGGTALVIWWEYVRHTPAPQHPSLFACQTSTFRWEKTLFHFSLFTFIFLTAMGGLLELIQAHCTTTRSGEWLDFWADGAGALLANVVGLVTSLLWFKARG